jgi:ABC-2 type transport system ATP-binding protein
MSLLSIKNLSFTIDKHLILNDISVQFNKAEIACILGPSGSGKTTLLRHIIGEIAAQSGEIKFAGKLAPHKAMQHDVGYMLQDETLYKDISVEANLQFFAAIYKIKNAPERIDELLNLVELTEHRKKILADCSGGMKRRLSLAVTLLHNPKLLVLDEPTVGIDPVLREKFWSFFSNLKSNGVSIIVTTHVMSDAQRCDKLVIIKNGALAAYGNPTDLLQEKKVDNIEALYLKVSIN